MIPNRVTPIPELNRARLLKNCPMTGFVPSVALPDRCLWRRVADTKIREFVVNSFAEQCGPATAQKSGYE
jgi:hypothetical protein